MTAERLPALFIGHGSPMNALADNVWTRAWRALGRERARPRAVLAVSAHWYVRGTGVTVNEAPPTIHDFGGFPPALYAMQYPARGDASLAARVLDALAPLAAVPRSDWGLDHGTWSVLVHVFPRADVPVIQLSIDATQPAAFHYDVGRRLAGLRDEGVLLIGSGGIVHNLQRVDGSPGAAVPPWAAAFDARVRECVRNGDHAALIDYASLTPDALLSVPTPEHYLPLLYVLGSAARDEPVSFPCLGFDLGTISMAAVRVGQ